MKRDSIDLNRLQGHMKTKTILLIISAIVIGYIAIQFIISPHNTVPIVPGELPTLIPSYVPPPTQTSAPTPTETSAPSPTETSAPTPTETQIPQPTSLKVPPSESSQPLVALQGQLFFDIDLSGKQNQIPVRYYRDLIYPREPEKRQNLDFVRSLRAYKEAHPYLMDGTLIYMMEPGLSGYEVCGFVKEIKNGCALTDADGKFEIKKDTIREGDTVGIRITDATTEKIGTMAYQNMYVKSVTLPTYEINGYMVPEQTLIQTDMMKLSNTHYLSANEEPLLIGLSQGYMPYQPVKGEMYVYSFFDHDSRLAYGLDWRNRNCLMPPAYNQPPNKITDGTDGVIFGGQKGDLVLSMGFGIASVNESEEMGRQVIVMIDNAPHSVVYSHLDTVLVNNLQEVFVGQIIGTVGRTGKEVGAPQVHVEIGNNTKLDPFGDPSGESAPVWTRFFSPVEFP